jgi:hypothetical protein
MDVVKSAEMLEKFPAGCVPCFEAKDGTRIHQSAAIAAYGEFRYSSLVCASFPYPFAFRLVACLCKGVSFPTHLRLRPMFFYDDLQLLVIPVLITSVDNFPPVVWHLLKKKTYNISCLL